MAVATIVLILVCALEIITHDKPLYATGPNATPEGVWLAVATLGSLIGAGLLLTWSMDVFKKGKGDHKGDSNSQGIKRRNAVYKAKSIPDPASYEDALLRYFIERDYTEADLDASVGVSCHTLYRATRRYGVLRAVRQSNARPVPAQSGWQRPPAKAEATNTRYGQQLSVTRRGVTPPSLTGAFE